jgi:hypothetical protein
MRTHRPVLAFLAVGALVLAACGGSDEDSSADTAAVETTTTELDSALATNPAAATTTTAASPPATDSPVTQPPEIDPPATEAAPDVDRACLVGEWVVTEEEMNGFYDGLESTVDAPLTISVEGSAPITFSADGTYLWDPEFVLTVDVAGAGGTGATTGDITGDWSASDGVVTTTSDVNALEVSITVNGATINGSDLANGFLNSSPINGVTYSCDGPAPILDFKTADPDVTVPVTLTPV